MIPKIVHYCWFGGNKLPHLATKCINSWKKKLPEYTFILWNEDNFDIESSIPYVKDAYNQKKYAFVSDYVRLYALYTYGGIYLDTDVEVLKSFDDLLFNESFIGRESDCFLCTAVIGARPNMKWILELLNLYAERSFIRSDGTLDVTTNVIQITFYWREKSLEMSNKMQILPELTVYPICYFSPKSWESGKCDLSDNTYSIHYFAGTWHSMHIKMLSFFFSNGTIAKLANISRNIRYYIKSFIKGFK